MTFTTLDIPISQLKRNTGQIPGVPKNPRIIKDNNFKKLKDSIVQDPEMLELREIIAYKQGDDYIIIGGNMRFEALKALNFEKAKCKVITGETTPEQLKRIILKDNSAYGEWDFDELANEWDEALIRACAIDVPMPFDEEDVEKAQEEKEIKKLKDDFIFPPFSVLNAQQGEWIDRKAQWLSLGIKSEEGREQGLTYAKSCQSGEFYKVKNKLRTETHEPTTDEVVDYCNEHGIKLLQCTSIFDPVLTELMYRWFNKGGGSILDPFAGGSVRGIVAAKLGFDYFGNDLRQEQIDANIKNANEVFHLGSSYMPHWTCGDSAEIDNILDADTATKGKTFDMIFSCPPYADLEVYSNDERDISNMDYDNFLTIYKKIIAKCCQRLKDNRFAVFVVGDVRDKKGYYRNFVNDTIESFEAAGLKYYNQFVFINAYGSLCTRIRKQFNAGRKNGKTHQNVLVFAKGDITAEIAEYEKTSVTKAFSMFNESRKIANIYDDVLVFFKGNPKAIKNVFGECQGGEVPA